MGFGGGQEPRVAGLGRRPQTPARRRPFHVKRGTTADAEPSSAKRSRAHWPWAPPRPIVHAAAVKATDARRSRSGRARSVSRHRPFHAESAGDSARPRATPRTPVPITVKPRAPRQTDRSREGAPRSRSGAADEREPSDPSARPRPRPTVHVKDPDPVRARPTSAKPTDPSALAPGQTDRSRESPDPGPGRCRRARTGPGSRRQRDADRSRETPAPKVATASANRPARVCARPARPFHVKRPDSASTETSTRSDIGRTSRRPHAR